MKFKDLIDEELKQKNNLFLEGTLNSQKKSFLFVLAKLKIITQIGNNNIYENHWKGELRSIISEILKDFNGVRDKNEFTASLFKNLDDLFISVNNLYKNKYPEIYKQNNGFTDEQLVNLANVYFPKLANWIFDSFYKIRKLNKNERKEKIAECCKDFLEKI